MIENDLFSQEKSIITFYRTQYMHMVRNEIHLQKKKKFKVFRIIEKCYF